MPAATGEKPMVPQGTVPRLSGKRYKEADQSGRKNQLSRRDRSFQSTGDEMGLQTARPAKPAEPPDGPNRSPTCHRQGRACGKEEEAYNVWDVGKCISGTEEEQVEQAASGQRALRTGGGSCQPAFPMEQAMPHSVARQAGRRLTNSSP
jgi:hypothetical protein